MFQEPDLKQAQKVKKAHRLPSPQQYKKFFNNENVVDIMSKIVSWAKYVETEHGIGYC